MISKMMLRNAYSMLLLILLSGSLQAQATAGQNPSAVLLADLQQDVQLLQKQVAQIQLDLEDLRRQSQLWQNNAAKMQELESLSALYKAEDARNRQEVIALLSQQIEKLAVQTQNAIHALAKSIDAAKSPPKFDTNFPKEGITYTVQKGDTLSTIARQFNSTVRDLQNANQIADPKELQAGQVIFIPQAKPHGQ